MQSSNTKPTVVKPTVFRRRRRVLLAPWALAFLMLGLVACNGKPASNTPEYLAAHGIEPGKVNHLAVGKTRFTVPVDVSIQVESSGDIVRGQASALWLMLPLPEPETQKPTAQTQAHQGRRTVRVHIMKVRNDVEQREDLARYRTWKTTQDRPDLGLRMYVDEGQRGGWGAVSYEALSADDRTPMGNPVQILCDGPISGANRTCLGSYRLNPEVVVEYVFNHSDIEKWRQCHRHVVSSIQRFTQ